MSEQLHSEQFESPAAASGGRGPCNEAGLPAPDETRQEPPLVRVYLTTDEIYSLLAQYKDRHLGTADNKLAEAYKAATGKDI